MIITLTPNTGIDHTIQVPSFQLDQTIRATDSAWGMAGKAADVSWVLGKLGVPTRALGFAAGATGQRMENMLRERGVGTDFTWVNGEFAFEHSSRGSRRRTFDDHIFNSGGFA